MISYKCILFIILISTLVVIISIILMLCTTKKSDENMTFLDTKKKLVDIDKLTRKYITSNMCVNEEKLWAKKGMNFDIQRENLLLLKNFLNKYNVKYFIDCGTLLGAVRDKGFIKGDTDADINVSQEDIKKVRKNILDLEKEGFLVWRNFDKKKTDKDWFMALSIIRQGEYIDIYQTFFKISFELINYPFLDSEFPIPKYYEQYLEEHYGSSWRIPNDDKGPGNWERGMPKYVNKYSIM